MSTRRRVFRPEVVGTLEDRLVLSAIVPSNAAIERAVETGPPTHPIMIVTEAGSSQSKVLTRSGSPLHDEPTFSTHVLNVTTSKASGISTVTFKVDYHNESKTPITSATLEVTLGSNLSYLPGEGHTPPGGELAAWDGSNGSQMLSLRLPSGIAPGVEGELEFQAEYRAS